ncbi:hypothetical protein OS493_008471 [Desmophyllum pertusum]|uniref:Uncharacterized protein n=1 Tax=Desmophyllum pertusum TaxID=174260 RepID=A0A9W9ZRU8_9CNID|nr:hypothetical protein OS493_008471 [Desmophyllum pertusum]
MSFTGEAVLASIETNPSLFFSKHSMLSEALFTSPLVQTTVELWIPISGQKIGRKSHLDDLLSKNINLHFVDITAEKLFDYGRTRIKELIEENTPESLQESELLRIVKSALGLPQNKGIPSCRSWNEDNISSVLWHAAEERWKEATDKLFLYTPEKMITSAIELAQERIKAVVTSSSLVSQILEAGDFLSTTTQCIKHEAEILSQVLCERREHALAGVSEFWKTYHENQTTLEALYSLVNDHILSHLACEGIELFSQYVWTTRPEFYEQDFLEANLQYIDDEGFHFIAEERVPRRSILYIGSR